MKKRLFVQLWLMLGLIGVFFASTVAAEKSDKGYVVRYNHLVEITSLTNQAKPQYNSAGGGRLWVHFQTRFGSTQYKDRAEIRTGEYWEVADRPSSGAQYFVLKKVEDDANVGPVKYGDKFKIMAVYAHPQQGDKVLEPNDSSPASGIFEKGRPCLRKRRRPVVCLDALRRR